MNKLNDTAKKFNMKINVNTTKTKVVFRDEGVLLTPQLMDRERRRLVIGLNTYRINY
jgi:hypothetical protein